MLPYLLLVFFMLLHWAYSCYISLCCRIYIKSFYAMSLGKAYLCWVSLCLLVMLSVFVVSVFMLTILMLTVISPSAVMLTYFGISITMLTCSAQRKCLYADHIYADCHYSEWRYVNLLCWVHLYQVPLRWTSFSNIIRLSLFQPSVLMLIIFMLSVIMKSVVIQSVVAPHTFHLQHRRDSTFQGKGADLLSRLQSQMAPQIFQPSLLIFFLGSAPRHSA